jgi:hypothetical protein
MHALLQFSNSIPWEFFLAGFFLISADTSVSAKGNVGGGNVFNAAPLFGNNYFPSATTSGDSAAGAEGSVLEPAASSSPASSATVVITLFVLLVLGLIAYLFHEL